MINGKGIALTVRRPADSIRHFALRVRTPHNAPGVSDVSQLPDDREGSFASLADDRFQHVALSKRNYSERDVKGGFVPVLS